MSLQPQALPRTLHFETPISSTKETRNSSVVKTYDGYNRLATETDARGNVKTHLYEHARGLHLSTIYTVVDGTAQTSARSFTYNQLGQLTQLTDDSGVRTFTYNTYGEPECDSLAVDGDTHLVTELRDTFVRSTGYTYAKNGSEMQKVSTGYGTDGRINSAGFMHYSADRASDEHKHIIRIQLERVGKRLAARGLKMELSDAAAELVADHGYDPVYGARPLKRAIQHDLLDPLSMAILAGKYPEGSTIRIDAKDGSICFN